MKSTKDEQRIQSFMRKKTICWSSALALRNKIKTSCNKEKKNLFIFIAPLKRGVSKNTEVTLWVMIKL